MNSYIQHHGIKGQKWGVRRFQNKDGSLTPAGKDRYYVDNDPSVKFTKNADGSYNIPKNFKFNRVGRSTMDINKSGVLYMSYGKRDAARYVRSLGPTPIGKLLGTAGEAMQHLECVEPMRMASKEQVIKGLAEVTLKNKKVLDELNNDQMGALMVTADLNKSVDEQMIKYAINNPNTNAAKRLAQGVSFWLGDGSKAETAKIVYKHFIDQGFDAIPDLTDRDGGVSETAMIVMNTDKVKITSTTKLTKDVMKEAKAFVKTLAEIQVEDIYDDI